MAEELFSIKIVGDSAGAAISTSKSSISGEAGKGKTGALGTIMTGVLHGVGIATGIGLISEIVSNMKVLTSVVQLIFRMVITLLRPIEMIVVSLLMPILYILKPIIILINQIFAPFIKLAMSMFRAGSKAAASGNVVGAAALFAGAGATMLSGLNAIIMALSTEVLKQIIDTAISMVQILVKMISGMISFIVGFLGGIFNVNTTGIIGQIGDFAGTVNAQVYSLGEAAKTGLSYAASVALSTQASVLALMAESLGVDSKDVQAFTKGVDTSIASVLGAEGMTGKMTEALQGLSDKGVPKISDILSPDIDGSITKVFVTQMGDLGIAGADAAKSAAKAMVQGFIDGLEEKLGSNRITGALVEIVTGGKAKTVWDKDYDANS
jgi:hypothetical protein